MLINYICLPDFCIPDVNIPWISLVPVLIGVIILLASMPVPFMGYIQSKFGLPKDQKLAKNPDSDLGLWKVTRFPDNHGRGDIQFFPTMQDLLEADMFRPCELNRFYILSNLDTGIPCVLRVLHRNNRVYRLFKFDYIRSGIE